MSVDRIRLLEHLVTSHYGEAVGVSLAFELWFGLALLFEVVMDS